MAGDDEKPQTTMVDDARTIDTATEKHVLPDVSAVDYSGAHKKTDPKEIALVRKLDRYIMPMLWSMYWLNYLDRNAIALARLSSLDKDLGLSDVQYQTCVAILFVGYIIGTVPSNMFINRTRPSRYMGTVMALWAIVSALTAVSTNFTGLLLTRFFLGVTEGPFYPGAVYMLTVFYNRKEVATRIAILYTGNVLATAFAGLIAAGIYSGLDGTAGIAGWQWLFILQGVVTFVIAIIGFFVLPDFPSTTKWLTPEERELAHNRMEMDITQNKGTESTLAGLKQAVRDPLVWCFMFMAHFHLAANGFKNFFPSVVSTLGLPEIETLLLVCPPYFIATIATIFVSWTSGRFNERTWHITGSKLVAVVGFIVAPAANTIAGRYIGMIIFCVGTYGVNSLILGWCGAVCGQTREKKSAAVGMVVGFMNASFIWTPYVWRKVDAPRYVPAMATSAAFSIATFLVAWLVKFIILRRNKKLRASDDEVTNFFVY
ncbi:MFS general substrate transporter [Thozetella sp. PMI_491]|nr:MFS general substrate transporter [Thozetella sp. PMI_491]